MAGAGGHVSSMFFDLVPGVRIGEVPLHAKTGNCAELDSFFFAPKALECRINSYYICMYTYIYMTMVLIQHIIRPSLTLGLWQVK